MVAKRFFTLSDQAVHLGMWLLAIVLGLGQVVVWRNYIGPDGISYLDVGDAYWHGAWQQAINGYWSPLYSWILGLALKLLQPAAYWEATTVHLLNYGLFLGTMGCFTFLTRELRLELDQQRDTGRRHIPIPSWAFLALAYGLFLWASIDLIAISTVTPEMLVAAWVFLIAALFVRIHRGVAGWGTYLLIGVVLGLGYLTKSVMFPLALVWLGVLAWWQARRHLYLVLLASVVFVAVSTPFLLVLSQSKGRPTYGDSGRLNYAWFVNGTTRHVHWRGEEAQAGTPAQPPRLIFQQPDIYEFGTPVNGTYPLWYDPSHWYEGVETYFDIDQQARVLLENAQWYLDLIVQGLGGLIIILVVFFMLGPMDIRRVSGGLESYWFLLVPVIAPLCLFWLVYVETRYIAPFVVLGLLVPLIVVRLPADDQFQAIVSGLTLIAVVFLLLPVLQSIAQAPIERFSRHRNWEVAQALWDLDVKPGAQVAFVGYTFDAYWARLARVKIVADVLSHDEEIDLPDDDFFWNADFAQRQRMLQVLEETGAEAIVTDSMPVHVVWEGWQPLGETGYHALLLFP